jgi:hypothetical protein
MAGAVSAGAYTAGVFDFLMRALAAHEEESAKTGTGLKIVVKAISGTSAGGTTACLGAASLIAGLGHEKETYLAETEGDPEQREYVVGLRKLHDIWVKELSLTGEAGLLGVGDLAESQALTSILDGTAIDRAADRTLGEILWSGKPHDFLTDPLDLFVTTTGINGVVYEAQFHDASGGKGHMMARHGLARHFAFSGLGSEPIKSRWLEIWRDRGKEVPLSTAGETIDLCCRDTIAQKGKQPTVWTELRETGIATGAFPGGLSARFVTARMSEHGVRDKDGWAEGGAWPFDVDPELLPHPDFGEAEAVAAGDATYVAVDGGTCNNEPFEFARFAIRRAAHRKEDGAEPAKWRLAVNPREPEKADRAVIMIDPFPEGPQFAVAWPEDPEGDARALPGLAGRLFGALIAQARFKPMELAAAMDADVRSRYLIAPSRSEEKVEEDQQRKEHIRGAAAIASGAIGGFSGFFDIAFRRHDFVLGQKNCQSFLKEHFKLASTNQVFGNDKSETQRTDRDILPLYGELAKPIEQPAWPRMSIRALEEVFDTVSTRLDAVLEHALETRRPVWLVRLLTRGVWSVWIRDITLRSVCRRLEAALVQHDLLDVKLPDAAVTPYGRRILTALIAPGPAVRTTHGVACAIAREDARAKALSAPQGPTGELLAETKAVFQALSQDKNHRYRLCPYEKRHGHQTWIVGNLGPGWARRNLPFLEVDDDLPGP